MMDKNLADKIRFLAQKYENADFLKKDPSQFMHRFSDVQNQEAAAFLAANLAFGQRAQILSHVQMILDAAQNSLVEWILSEKYKNFFHFDSRSELKKSFYRMYTNQDMILFFDGLKKIFESEKTAGEFFRKKWENEKDCRVKPDNDTERKSENDTERKSENDTERKPENDTKRKPDNDTERTQENDTKCKQENDTERKPENDTKRKPDNDRKYLHFVIEDAFDKNCALIPHTKNSAAKKVNMMLRWLVRGSSPVDLGLWTWFDKKNLLMPLDVHVMRQANELGLIKSKSANLKTAVGLTEKMKEIFPDDPTKADFALFGFDIEK